MLRAEIRILHEPEAFINFHARFRINSVVIIPEYAILKVYSEYAYDPSARDGEFSGGRYFLILRATSIPEANSVTGFLRSPLISVRSCFQPSEGPNICWDSTFNEIIKHFDDLF
jgi:hypothetical protein